MIAFFLKRQPFLFGGREGLSHVGGITHDLVKALGVARKKAGIFELLFESGNIAGQFGDQGVELLEAALVLIG